MAELTNKEKFKLLNPEYPKIIVTDMDGVLVDIDFLWCLRLLNNKELFDPYFDIDPKLLKNIIHIVSRKQYNLDQWLKKDGVEIPAKIQQAFYKLYDSPGFYNQCPASPFTDSLKQVIYTKNCEKMYVISDCINEDSADDKYQWLKREFSDDYGNLLEKVIFVPIINKDPNNKITKAQVINEVEIDYDIFIEDLLPNIIDVAKNTKSSGKEFNIIRKGYNEETDELMFVANEHDLSVNYITLSYK